MKTAVASDDHEQKCTCGQCPVHSLRPTVLPVQPTTWMPLSAPFTFATHTAALL
jgi:hypothetical protein